MNHDTAGNNPQYAIKLLERGNTDIAITLAQEDSRGASSSAAGRARYTVIIAEVYDNKGRAVSRASRGTLVANKGAPLREVSLQFTVTGGSSTPLTLLICCYMPNTECSYSLHWYASKRIAVTPLTGVQALPIDDATALTTTATTGGRAGMALTSTPPTIGASRPRGAYDVSSPLSDLLVPISSSTSAPIETPATTSMMVTTNSTLPTHAASSIVPRSSRTSVPIEHRIDVT
jgi:hypothetical protein